MSATKMIEGWRLWVDWHQAIAPDNVVEIQALEADRGNHLGYVRVVATRTELAVEEPIVSVPPQYTKRPLLRTSL